MTVCENCKQERKKFTSCELCWKSICIQCRNKNKPDPPCDVTNVCDVCNKEWGIE